MHSTDQAAQRLGTIAAEVFAYELEEARRAGAIGYLARVLVQATMPHSNPGDVAAWGRQNGSLSLVIQPGIRLVAGQPRSIGLPYGAIPRLLLAWVTTEAVRTRQRQLLLGDTLSGFMRQHDLTPTGGRWGTIPRLREQMRRLFASTIACSYDGAHGVAGAKLDVASEYSLWWDPEQPDQAALWHSSVTLGARFYDEVISRPVPIDMRTLKALKRSPLALDVYAWLTYRFSYLQKPVTVPWEALQLQFGCDYKLTRQFRAKFTGALAKVHTHYPEARVDIAPSGLLLQPSPTHIRRHPSRLVPGGDN